MNWRKHLTLAAIGCFAFLIASPAWAADTATKTKAKDKEKEEAAVPSVAIFRLHGALEEAPPPVDFNFNLEPRRSLRGLLERFARAKKDANLKALVLVFDEPQIGMGQLQELRDAIQDLRSADKDVYCYLEEARLGAYALATSATKIVLAPGGDLMIMGINVESPYFKGLLDKVHVEADIEHVGPYKSAGEPFTRTGPSPEAKEMMNWLIQDIYDQLVEQIAKGRQLSVDEVKGLIDKGQFHGEDAKKAKLVDEVAYAEDFTASLKKRYGDNVAFNHDYGAKKAPELDFSNVFSLFKSFSDLMNKARGTEKPAIAIAYVDGMIVTGKSEEGLFASQSAASTTIRRALGKARDDDSIKAVVLRVDSPGGSALASDIIWHATQELKAKKPLIVSMGNVAGSGGYYVSCGAATIFADPGTLTGSIGVLGGKLVTRGLWDWAGITFDQTKFGKNADLYSSDHKFDEQQREQVKKYMLQVYGEFTDRVKQGRGDKLKKDMDQLAGGRVYTGRQALQLGLVDKLGGLQEAVKFAAAEAGVTEYEIREIPESKSFGDLLVEALTGEKKDKDSPQIHLSMPGLGWTTQAPAIHELLGMLSKADPERCRTVVRSLMRIEMLGQERVMLVTPTEISVR
jgi:protease IV